MARSQKVKSLQFESQILILISKRMGNVLKFTRSLTLNFSGDLIIKWSMSEFCLLPEIYFFANKREYFIDSGWRHFHLLGI